MKIVNCKYIVDIFAVYDLKDNLLCVFANESEYK